MATVKLETIRIAVMAVPELDAQQVAAGHKGVIVPVAVEQVGT